MMKYTFLVLLGFIINQLSAQSVDSVAIKQVDSLIKVFRDLTAKKDYKQALQVNAIAKKLALERLGKNSISYGKCCFVEGKLYFRKGEYQNAEREYLEYSAILTYVKGEMNMDYAWSLTDLGQVSKAMGQFDKAESLYLKSKEIIGKIQGFDHPDYASSLNELATMYRNMGLYEKAEPLALNAKSIREKSLGRNHTDYAWSLNNLANLYTDMGAFDKAELYYLEAKAIWEHLFGKENENHASVINNLAALYFAMGVYNKAESLFLESCISRGKLIGKDNADYAGSLNNLASLYMQIGNYQKAEPLFLESKSIREKIYGKVHEEYANVLCNLGTLYGYMANYEKAESSYLEAKSIWEKVAGVEHPEYATSIYNLAILYLELNQLDKAEPLLLKANAIYKQSLGLDHADFTESQRVLSKLFLLQGRISQGVAMLEEVSKQQKVQLLKATTYLSERELTEFVDNFQNHEDELGTYYYTCPTAENCILAGKLASGAYDHALFYKGFLLTALVRLKTLSQSTTESKAIYDRLKGYSRRLAYEYVLPIDQRTDVVVLEEKVNATEKELANALAGYSESIRQVKWNEVQRELKQNEAVIEFVRFEINFPKSSGSVMYIALFISKNTTEPILIPLFEEKSLDSLLQSKSDRKADYVNSLYTLADRGAVAIEGPKKSLYEILWKPLEKELTSTKTIYFSPSGLLHRINLDAIPINETETLADRYKLIELNSTRQLVIPTQIKNGNNDAVLYGGIQYEQDSMVQINEPLMASRSRGELSFSNADTTLRGGSWTYLAGTEREVNAIEKMMQTNAIQIKLKKGYDATEESFKNIGANNNPSPRILHIATHGYFFADPKSTNVTSSNTEPVFKISDHPMLRSGLIMAGGNAAWQGKRTLEGREDGILTAYEISQMNLSNTELVVLSACETGLGDIQGNEGVYGLQRAFKIAGAKYLIMSLWQVPDKQTSLLMTNFYKKWLENKMSIPDAFHAAQKELREIGLDPYQWAGFVLVE